MPIEIKEMHIKIHLDEGPNKGNAGGAQGASKKGTEAIINACVETVIEILEQQKER